MLAPAWGEPWTRSPSLSHADLALGSPDHQSSTSKQGGQPSLGPCSLEMPEQVRELPSCCWEGGFAWPRGRAHAVSMSFSPLP